MGYREHYDEYGRLAAYLNDGKPGPTIRVSFDGTEEQAPLLEQPALFPGIYPASVGEQGALFDLGESERKPAAEQKP